MVTGTLQENFKQAWKEYEVLIFKYASLEEKRVVKKLLSEYQAFESECAGITL